MKLINETLDTRIEPLFEDENGKKSLYIQGVFLQAGITNKNGRMYSPSLMEREVLRYTQENIKNNRSYGELSHPATPTVNLDRVCLMVRELNRDGNNYIGKAKITDTPMGNIVKSLINEGANLGVSSRGVGSLKPNPKGWQDVQEDFKLLVAADVVSDPSAPSAYVKGILENAEWVYDSVNNTWLEEKLDNIKKELHTLSKRQIEDRAFHIFEDLLSDIAGLKHYDK